MAENCNMEFDFWKEFESRDDRQKYWRNMFDQYAEMYNLRHGSPADRAVFLEIHPFHISQKILCTNDCIWCTRGDERDLLSSHRCIGIDPERLLNVLRQLKNNLHEGVLLSGNCTEPLLYPRIDEIVRIIKRNGLRLRIYSNFYHGDRLLSTISLWNDHDFLRVSIDGFSEQAYSVTHRPVNPDAFSRTLRNLEKISTERDRRGQNFGIGLTWLLTRENADIRDIREAIYWADKHNLQSIRFRVPITPLTGKMNFCPAESQIDAEELKGLHTELQAFTPKKTKVTIHVLPETTTQPDKPFNACHYYRIMSILGATGHFFPCTSMSLTAAVQELGFGNINDTDFDYSTIRKAFTTHWHRHNPKIPCDKQRCECTRFEYSVNEWLDALTGMDDTQRQQSLKSKSS